MVSMSACDLGAGRPEVLGDLMSGIPSEKAQQLLPTELVVERAKARTRDAAPAQWVGSSTRGLRCGGRKPQPTSQRRGTPPRRGHSSLAR
jgi:hypothetical protein